MKKVLILLIVLTVGFIGYDIYEFINMQNISKEYETKQNEYHKLLNEEAKKNEEIISLNDQLNTLKENNIENNKEYRIWTNLNKTIQDLLK